MNYSIIVIAATGILAVMLAQIPIAVRHSAREGAIEAISQNIVPCPAQ